MPDGLSQLGRIEPQKPSSHYTPATPMCKEQTVALPSGYQHRGRQRQHCRHQPRCASRHGILSQRQERGQVFVALCSRPSWWYAAGWRCRRVGGRK